MLAVETSMRGMRELGEDDYARRAVDGLVAEAELLPMVTMLTTPVRPGPLPGLYGRAWMTGVCLIEAVGWGRVKLLAHAFDAAGKPDVPAWVRWLTPDERASVEAVLGEPSPAWV